MNKEKKVEAESLQAQLATSKHAGEAAGQRGEQAQRELAAAKGKAVDLGSKLKAAERDREVLGLLRKALGALPSWMAAGDTPLQKVLRCHRICHSVLGKREM